MISKSYCIDVLKMNVFARHPRAYSDVGKCRSSYVNLDPAEPAAKTWHRKRNMIRRHHFLCLNLVQEEIPGLNCGSMTLSFVFMCGVGWRNFWKYVVVMNISRNISTFGTYAKSTLIKDTTPVLKNKEE